MGGALSKRVGLRQGRDALDERGIEPAKLAGAKRDDARMESFGDSDAPFAATKIWLRNMRWKQNSCRLHSLLHVIQSQEPHASPSA